MIRRYERADYEAVISLLKSVGLPEISAEELEGYGLVWVEEKPVGFVWGLTNEGATVYVDHFAVHPDYRSKDATGRSRIAVELILKLMMDMKKMGKTRIIGVLQETPYGRSLERIYNQVGMKFCQPHAFVHGNIDEVINNLVRLKNV